MLYNKTENTSVAVKIKSVIFDMDGTLIDSMCVWEDVDKAFLIENGITPPDGISDIMKKLSMNEAADYFIELGVNMSPEAVTERIEQMVYDEYKSFIPLKENVTELLDVLDSLDIPYCVATANYRLLTDVILKRYGIYDRFRFIYTCEENEIKKDSPMFFKNISGLLGTAPENTAVLDDSFHCLEASRNSGFFTVAVFDECSNDWEDSVSIAQLAVKNLSEFTNFLLKKFI